MLLLLISVIAVSNTGAKPTSAPADRQQPLGLAAKTVSSCGTLDEPHYHIPLGMRVIPRWQTAQFTNCDCAATMPSMPRVEQYTNNTAQVGHDDINFDNVHGHFIDNQHVGCTWTWQCRHSTNRFPRVYEEARLVRRGQRGALACGPNGEHRCKRLIVKEMVLREVTEPEADKNGQLATYWGVSMEERTVGYTCTAVSTKKGEKKGRR